MADKRNEFEMFLGRLIGMAAKAFRQRMERNLAQAGHDLTLGHAIFLKLISDGDGVSQQELAEHLQFEKTTVTRIIDTLEAKNLAVRVQDKSDRRQNMVYITPEGKEMMDRLLPVARLTEQQALQDIDIEKVSVCKEVLQQIRRNLTE